MLTQATRRTVVLELEAPREGDIAFLRRLREEHSGFVPVGSPSPLASHFDFVVWLNPPIPELEQELTSLEQEPRFVVKPWTTNYDPNMQSDPHAADPLRPRRWWTTATAPAR